MTPPLINFIQQRFGPDRHLHTVLEWCAGPAFLGFGLLAEGMCDVLCLADVSPKAIRMCEQNDRSEPAARPSARVCK
jgi:predicted RNA methylase